MGTKIGVDANVDGNLKYQFLGNRSSKFAMSIQPEMGFGFFPKKNYTLYASPLNFSAEIPLLMTYHFNDDVFFTVAPKIYDAITPRGNYGLMSYAMGLTFGKKEKWTFGYAFVSLFDKPDAAYYIQDNAHTFEIGLKIKLFKDKDFVPSIK